MKTRAAVYLGVLVALNNANAHHSIGAFYVNDDTSELSGTVTSVDWTM